MNLAIVLVSFNTRALLRDCLRTLDAAPPTLARETLVVDNASRDDSAAMVAAEFPAVRLIRNATNLGFARANNLGWRASSGAQILFLNSDTLVPPTALPALVAFLDAHPAAGICAPRLARADGSAQPFAFGRDPSPAYLVARGWNRLARRRALHDWDTRAAQRVDWVSGAGLCVRRAVLEQIGGWDENFFMYFEDNDLCLRARRAGWDVYYAPQATITHWGGASLAHNHERTRHYDASLRYFYAKHYSPLARVALEILLPFYRRMR